MKSCILIDFTPQKQNISMILLLGFWVAFFVLLDYGGCGVGGSGAVGD